MRLKSKKCCVFPFTLDASADCEMIHRDKTQHNPKSGLPEGMMAQPTRSVGCPWTLCMALPEARPEHLVNRDDQKKSGPILGKKIAWKSRNSCKANSLSCGCIGNELRAKCAHSWK